MENRNVVDAFSTIDNRRVIIFLSLAFGIAWLSALIVFLTGGLTNSSEILPGLPVAKVLIPIPYLWAPAIAAILTRWLTHEGWKDLGLHVHLGKSWRYWLMGWLLPAVLTVAGAVVFFLIFPIYFDTSLTTFRQDILATTNSVPSWSEALIAAVIGIAITPITYGLSVLGEVYGWLGYLFPRLMPAGWRRAVVFLGLIWGIWYLPLIFMGDQYGSTYEGFPWLGALVFLWIMLCNSVFFAWLTLRAHSVWPAILGRAAINGTAALSILALIGNPNPLVGPYSIGILGSVGYAVVAIILFLSPEKP